jgi:DNA-binding beta-propeller fold protein YncE
VPGAQADGSVLLPNQWSLRPAGTQIAVGDFPVNIAVHPSGDFAAVLHSGYGQNEVVVLDVKGHAVTSRAPLTEAFYGLAFTADGTRLVASGASHEELHLLRFQKGFITEHETLPLRDAKERSIPAGVALDRAGRRAFVANLLGHRISLVDLEARTNRTEVLLASEPLARALRDEKASKSEDEDAITKRAEALLDLVNSDAPYPYGVVVDEARSRLYVSLWAQSAVQVIDLKTLRPGDRWQTAEHPNEMVLTRSGRHLMVANANRNTVSVLDTETGKTLEKLTVELVPNAPPGSTPNSVALSPDEKLLFVANANINAVGVFDISTPGRSRSLGFIPVGWYPTSVRVTPDGKHLLVANGKGQTSRSNRHGPRPGGDPPATVKEYIAGLLQGTVSVIDLPSRDKLEEAMKKWTTQTLAGMPPTAGTKASAGDAANPVPRKTGDPTPIRHVIYIIKENRTYDQVLGDMPQGRGDPTLCLFPESVTPNHHKLAREFVLLDNFYVESEVSADGHEWTVGAYATDFVEKLWPMSYGHNQLKKYSYPAEGNFTIAAPAGGYLWDCAREAGVTYRSYGEFVTNAKTNTQPGTSRVAALRDHFDPWYRSFDMDYPDSKRADRFISELGRFEKEGEMPRLQIVRLPNDHTAGTSEGKHTPTALVADNDLALGRVVEAVSRSRFWASTAIFVVEDDAQNGPDHIDAHRTIAYAISPYVKRGVVDSTMYSTASMLRTMELILGLRPMSQFDATARPMHQAFTPQPDLTPYTAVTPRVDLGEKNRKHAWGGAESGRMNFAREDAADDLRLNEIVWRSVRGADSPMPAPVRAGFVLVRKGRDLDD